MDGRRVKNDMVLLIDAGNSRVKFGWLRLDSARREGRPLALAHAELDRLAPWLAGLPDRPRAAVGVNVAGDTIAAVIEEALSAAGVSCAWLASTAKAAGITNLYDAPTQLGADRWISLIGLGSHTDGPALLASFGTATTVDMLGAVSEGAQGRRFEGGIILPGPELMRRSLANGTAGLPYAEGNTSHFPRHTHAAITSGIAAAQAGAVLGQWRHAVETFGVAPDLYCTGGGWELVADAVDAALVRAQSDLKLPVKPLQWLGTPVLDGLAVMAKDLQPG